jgi:hypothetical protein
MSTVPNDRIRRGAIVVPLAVALSLSACQSLQPAPEKRAEPASEPAPSMSIASLYQQPAERSLIDGIRWYEDAAFPRAETSLRQALDQGLADRHDRAIAYKYLAFISCAFNRIAECEASFASAFDADPGFTLDAKEIGHPVWGPIYRRVAATHAR